MFSLTVSTIVELHRAVVYQHNGKHEITYLEVGVIMADEEKKEGEAPDGTSPKAESHRRLHIGSLS